MNPTMIPYSTAVACAVVTNVKAVTTAQAAVEDNHDQALEASVRRWSRPW